MLNESWSLSTGTRKTLTESVFSPAIKSEDRTLDFQLLFEAVPTPMLVLAPNPPYFSILAVNDSYMRATGKQRHELVGHNLFEVFPENPDDPTATGVSELRLSLNRALQDKTQDRMGVQKYDIPVADQSLSGFEARYWSPTNTPVIGSDGQVRCILHRAMDQAEEAQAESEERFKALFNQAASGMAQMDLTGQFLLVNRRYCDMLGRSEEEMLHLHMQELTEPEDLPESLKMLERIKQTGESYTIEKRYIRSDGALIWVRNYISLVRGRHGQPLSIMAVCQDITEQKEAALCIQKAQSELKKYASKLVRSNRDLERFAMIASHDLQEPLRKVMMFSDHLQMITAPYLSPEAWDDIERLQRATHKMQTLIDNLLDLSRIARRGHAFQRVNLSDTMREVQADLHASLKETNVRIELGELVEFEGDARQIQQLLSILINNALKFHREGVPPVVKVSSKFLDADYCQILVSDNGIGIKPEYQEKIFDAFVRLNSHDAYPGNGIGLTIVQKIVERHDGTIQVDSMPGQGSSFLVKLPIHQQNPVS